MTLYDLERYLSQFRIISKPNALTWQQLDPYYRRQNVAPGVWFLGT